MKYLIRSIKYFIRLVVIMVAAIAVMHFANLSSLTIEQMFATLTQTSKGWILLIFAVGSSAAYPRLGYRTHRFRGNLKVNKDRIVNVLASVNCVLVSEEDSQMEFIRNTGLSRVSKFFAERVADRITVAQQGEQITIEGRGKLVYRIMMTRLENNIE